MPSSNNGKGGKGGKEGSSNWMQPLQPISRDSLRGLKAAKDEEMLWEKVKNSVTQLHSVILRKAESSTDTFYHYQLPSFPISKETRLPVPGPEFYRDNMKLILEGLQILFPDCLVEHATLVTAQDGKLYDISKLDDKMQPFINKQRSAEYIVVDWS
jgi:hypothetical protein